MIVQIRKLVQQQLRRLEDGEALWQAVLYNTGAPLDAFLSSFPVLAKIQSIWTATSAIR